MLNYLLALQRALSQNRKITTVMGHKTSYDEFYQ